MAREKPVAERDQVARTTRADEPRFETVLLCHPETGRPPTGGDGPAT